VRVTVDRLMLVRAQVLQRLFCSSVLGNLLGGWLVSLPRYYQEKMGVPPPDQPAVIADIVKSYVEGLCWVMKYYYEGVASWEW